MHRLPLLATFIITIACKLNSSYGQEALNAFQSTRPTCNESFFIVEKSNKFGIAKSDGSLFVPIVHDSIYPLIENEICIWRIHDADTLKLVSFFGTIPNTKFLAGARFKSKMDGLYSICVNEKYGLIGIDLLWGIEPIYEDIHLYKETARVTDESGSQFTCKLNNNIYILRRNGDEIKMFENVSDVFGFDHSNFFKVQRDGKMALFSNQYITKFEFDDIYSIQGKNYFICRKANQIGKINTNGTIVESFHSIKQNGFSNLDSIGKLLVVALKSDDPNALQEFSQLVSPDSLMVLDLVSRGLVSSYFRTFGDPAFELQKLLTNRLIRKKNSLKGFNINTLEYKSVKSGALFDIYSDGDLRLIPSNPTVFIFQTENGEMEFSLGDVFQMNGYIKILTIY